MTITAEGFITLVEHINSGNMFHEERGIIADPNVFDPSYVPVELPFREPQMREITAEVTYFIRGSPSSHLLLTGKPGTGKTASVKRVAEDLKMVRSDVLISYINCWKYPTKHSVLSEVARQAGIAVPIKGVAPEVILERIEQTTRNHKHIIILDEADRLKDKELLYVLSRMNNTMLIVISNTKSFIYSIDPRIMSSLVQRTVEYPPYNVPQLTEILRKRALIGLYPGTYSEEVLRACASIGYGRGGDARIAINCLYSAAKIAEVEGSSSITIEHVKKVRLDMTTPYPLEPKYVHILNILRQRGPLTVGELYEEYSKVNPVSDRTFRKYLRELERLGMIYIERKRVKGNVRVVHIKGEYQH